MGSSEGERGPRVFAVLSFEMGFVSHLFVQCSSVYRGGMGGGGPPREDNTVYLTLASRIHEGRDGRKEKYGRKKIKKVDKKFA